jgi:hypothetical protein
MRCLLLLFLITVASCHLSPKKEDRKAERAFYYWKSNFRVADAERNTIDTLKVQTIYLKFFDVDWNNNTGAPIPVAQLRITDSSYLQSQRLNIIPVIFITNECIYKIGPAQVNDLAQKITSLTKSMEENYSLTNISEVQIDCDWTASTREKYFSLLNRLKELNSTVIFSATIRLHQIKFSDKTGVPPVSRGMLMCYNMGNLTNIETRNSILEIDELKKYIGDLHNYPLPLDVALPLFDWKVLFRKGKFSGLIEGLSDSLLTATAFNKNGNRFIAVKDTTAGGYEFKAGDLLRTEESSYKEVLGAAMLLSEKVSNRELRISLYHLDPVILNKYSTHEIENIYNAFR